MTMPDTTSLPEFSPPLFHNNISSSNTEMEESVAKNETIVDLINSNSAPSVAPFKTGDPVNNKRSISGTYQSIAGKGATMLELRVDVDGTKPLQKVSGDLFRNDGDHLAFLGSFIIDAPLVSISPSKIIIDGQANFSFATLFPRLVVSINRIEESLPNAAVAEAQFMTLEGAKGEAFSCKLQSPYFRRVEFETDFVQSVQPFLSYDTNLLSTNPPLRTLTVKAAFAEAGIEMIDSGGSGEVPLTFAGKDKAWTNRELHAAMVDRFELWGKEPGWKVWLLAATIHVLGKGFRGIMFDDQGLQRQGCAVFHDVFGGTTSEIVRSQLYTYVHELGHCFNICHSHEKESMLPPQPNRRDALSWMNYPEFYLKGNDLGEVAYWAAFPFQFDDPELIHLRHAFRNEIIMGGDAFKTGAAQIDPHIFEGGIEDRTGLRLKISSSQTYYLGEPVVVEIKLCLTEMIAKQVNARLHPNFGYVQVYITGPGGKTKTYRPFLHQCADPEIRNLSSIIPAIYDSAYIGYGKDGFYFNEPGEYELRALYHSMEGSPVFSNKWSCRVNPPASDREKEIANLFLGDEQGKLFFLLGSDAVSLKKGNEAFEEVIRQYPKHPLAVYPKLIKGMNASVSFKSIDAKTKKIHTRDADIDKCCYLLSDVVDAGTASMKNPAAAPGVDNITLSMAAKHLVKILQEHGDPKKAQTTAKKIMEYFSAKKNSIPGFVQDQIRKEINAALQSKK